MNRSKWHSLNRNHWHYYSEITGTNQTVVSNLTINPLPFWENITGLVSVADGEILRFIISHKIPLDKIIRHELASRGYDQNSRWFGFDEACKVWLN